MRILPILISLCITLTAWCQMPDLARWTDVRVINESLINTRGFEFAPVKWDGYIVFISSKDSVNANSQLQPPYFDIFYAGINVVDRLERSALFSRELNTPYHEGPATFDHRRKKIYFTRENVENDNLIVDDKRTANLQIFEAEFASGTWKHIEKWQHNSDLFTSCHPTLSEDGMIMIFVSDRPGGFGKMDLYYSIFRDSLWSEPVNLGPEINTAANEIFPYLHTTGHLIFSSDRNAVENGLDMYMSRYSDGSVTPAIHIPTPFNSDHDDFGIFLDASGTTGYFSSNRPGGRGRDDIYSFTSRRSLLDLDPTFSNIFSMQITEMDSDIPLAEAMVRYRSLPAESLQEFDASTFDVLLQDSQTGTKFSDSDGYVPLEFESDYTLVEVSYPGYKTSRKMYARTNPNKNPVIRLTLDQRLPPKPVEPKVSTLNDVELRVGTVVVFSNIYYELDSHSIREGAAEELDNLARVMIENPGLKVQLSAHTDSRGNEGYNQQLSDRRAEAAKAYLVSKNVSPDRIVALGFGESRLRNGCRDGVSCSELDHLFNRRTEVKILEN